MAQWEPNILHEITIIGNDQNIEGTTTISEINLVICNCNATETGNKPIRHFYVDIETPSLDENNSEFGAKDFHLQMSRGLTLQNDRLKKLTPIFSSCLYI